MGRVVTQLHARTRGHDIYPTVTTVGSHTEKYQSHLKFEQVICDSKKKDKIETKEASDINTTVKTIPITTVPFLCDKCHHYRRKFNRARSSKNKNQNQQCEQCNQLQKKENKRLLILIYGFTNNPCQYYKCMINTFQCYHINHFASRRYIVNDFPFGNGEYIGKDENGRQTVKKIPKCFKFEVCYGIDGENPLITKIIWCGENNYNINVAGDDTIAMRKFIGECKEQLGQLQKSNARLNATDVYVKNSNWGHNSHHWKFIHLLDSPEIAKV